MTMKNTALRRMTAGAGAVALALGGLAVASTAANAAVGPDQPGNPGEGSLIIHKYVADQATTSSDGTEQTITGGVPLSGVEFTIWQLGIEDGGTCVAIDLADTDAWTDQIPTGGAPADIAGVQAAGFCIVDTDDGLTLADGSLTFPELDLGLYYVAETDVSGAQDANGPVTVVSHAAPFYVTVPLPNDGDWVYDVHAYPKNQVLDAPVKTINDTDDQEGLSIGDTVEFTITQTVPKLNEAQGETYTSASIWDNMGTSFEYDETATLTLNGNLLVEGVDYEIDDATAPLVRWVLTGALADIEAGDVLEVVFTATVLEVTTTGEIANPGSTDPDKPGYGSEFNGTPGPEGPTPYTYWGNLNVLKVDQDEEPLVGAEFQVYPSADNATCEADVADAEGLVSTGTSDADGIVQWDYTTPASAPLGLFVANSSNGQLANPTKVYCLYETKVPAGYTGVGVQTVVLGAGSALVVDVNDLTIENVQKEGPDLPLTGAQGTMLMTLGGLLLVAIGAGAIVVARGRRRENAEI